MIAHVDFFGFFPLGDEAELEKIKIMQKEWHKYNHFIIIWGRKKVVSPLFCDVFYVCDVGKYVFFAAHEYGLGHYYIFKFKENASRKMLKKL